MAETNELMKRPLASDELVKARAWEILGPKVKSYLGADWIESEAPYIQKQIMRVLSRQGWVRDGERIGAGWMEGGS